MQTQNHIVTYQLRLGNYYMIFWNEAKKYWDLKKTKKNSERFATNRTTQFYTQLYWDLLK